MTTLVPRSPYSQDELDRLYPKHVKLQLVQVVSVLGADFQLPSIQNDKEMTMLTISQL